MTNSYTKIHERDLRGKTSTGWLDSKHTFSFGHFMDPNRMGLRALRVMNDDRVIPGAGFGTHPHNDMEIITIVLSGALAHEDSMGNGSVIRAGEVQKMSAGSGITHSEFNNSQDESVHFYQTWIVPNKRGIAPGYEQVRPEPTALKQGFVQVGGEAANDNQVSIVQDATLWMASPAAGTALDYRFNESRAGFLQVASGRVTANGAELKEGDGLELVNVPELKIEASSDSKLILFDLG